MLSACRSRRHDVDSRRVSECSRNTGSRVPSAAFCMTWTALALMQLVAEGAVRLDEPARAHLPGFRVADGCCGGSRTTASSLMVCPFVDAAGLVGDVEGLPHGSCRPRGLVPKTGGTPRRSK